MAYLFLLVGIVDLILAFINRDWGFTLAVSKSHLYYFWFVFSV